MLVTGVKAVSSKCSYKYYMMDDSVYGRVMSCVDLELAGSVRQIKPRLILPVDKTNSHEETLSSVCNYPRNQNEALFAH